MARMSHPEISVHVNLLGRRTKNAMDKHFKTALQVLQYLHSSNDEGITLCKADNLNLTIYTDAAYRGENSHLQTGAIMCLGNQLVGWYSQRQDVVSLSVTEAEYIADCEGTKGPAWAQQFLSEIEISTLPTLRTDSEGAYHLSKIPKFMRRSRHMEHCFHYFCQQVRAKKLTIYTTSGRTIR